MPKTKVKTGECKLCLQHKELIESHIIPKSIVNYVKSTSATGRLRAVSDVQRPMQDGFKDYLLCHGCDNGFSPWENRFRSHLFEELTRGEGVRPFDYDSWLTKFATSLTWRALIYLRATGHFAGFPLHRLESLESASQTWWSYLRGESESPEPFSQAFIPFRRLTSSDYEAYRLHEAPPNLNVYIARSFEPNFWCIDNYFYIISRVPFAMFVGIIQAPEPGRLTSIKLEPRGGRFDISNMSYPYHLFEFITSGAKAFKSSFQSISPNQRLRINESAMKDMQRLSKSGSFEAIRRDVELFGPDAFDKSRAEVDAIPPLTSEAAPPPPFDEGCETPPRP